MICFLTSSPTIPDTTFLNPANGFIDDLRRALPCPCRALNICSDPDDFDQTDFYAGLTRGSFERKGFVFSSFDVLDRRNANQAGALVRDAGLIILAGGHVPTQNRFFQQIGLASLLTDYAGVIIGISAGSMNSAKTVYAQPELEGEAVSKDYKRFLPGLGLTEAMILPHYQMIKDDVLDGLRVFEDIAYPDSVGRQFYILPDGSYIYIKDGQEQLRGEAYLLRDGVMDKICSEGESVPLTSN